MGTGGGLMADYRDHIKTTYSELSEKTRREIQAEKREQFEPPIYEHTKNEKALIQQFPELFRRAYEAGYEDGTDIEYALSWGENIFLISVAEMLRAAFIRGQRAAATAKIRKDFRDDTI